VSLKPAVSRVAIGIEHVPLACEEARRALALTLALGRSGTTVLADKADAFGIVCGSSRRCTAAIRSTS
jgi:hypothetical protein